MKQIGMGVLSLLVVLSVVGCKTPDKKVQSVQTPFEMMQEKMNAITSAGGLAAVGMDSSRNTSLALEKARTDSRAQLAQTMEIKIDSLQKRFKEEIGGGEDSELNELFSTATKTVTSKTIKGSVPRDQKYDTKDGVTTAYVLMVLDPKVIADAFEEQVNTKRNLYTRFRASQAFAELDNEVKKYEEFKKQDSSLPVGE